MPTLGTRSEGRLHTCHPDLQKVIRRAIEAGPDFTVLCGHRGRADQERAVAEGRSKARWPRSKHNRSPSEAVDLAPWPIDWHDLERFRVLARWVLGVAHGMGVRLRWGGDWDMDFDEADERGKLRDFPHFEMVM